MTPPLCFNCGVPMTKWERPDVFAAWRCACGYREALLLGHVGNITIDVAVDEPATPPDRRITKASEP